MAKDKMELLRQCEKIYAFLYGYLLKYVYTVHVKLG